MATSRAKLPYADLIVRGAAAVVTAPHAPAPLRREKLGVLRELDGAWIAASEGRIVAVGSERDVRAMVATGYDTDILDARGGIVTAGLVDCHTHAVFAGDRVADFERRNAGASYTDIHSGGGGIRTTVAATRAAIADGSIDALTRTHFDWLLRAGTTTAEVKSGYGLTVADEQAMLQSAVRVGRDHALRVVPTVLAAHTVPSEYDDRGADAYIDEVAIPALAGAADTCAPQAADIFIEQGSFDVAQARRYFAAAQEHALALRMHGDQFTETGAIELAIALSARSVDHLEATQEAGIAALAASDVAGVVLPTSSLFLGRPYAPARALVDAGAIVAVASDFNPGSSFAESLLLAMSLACVGGGLSTREAFNAATVNAAWVLGLDAKIGRIAVGYAADLVVFDVPAIEHLAYHVAARAVRSVVAGGRVVVG